jgi:glycosyltransferase involved in cell wall biosynthesis
MNNQRNVDVFCFGGEDWWYHNRGHIDMQLMRRFARVGTTVYINSIVLQKPSFKKATAGGKSFSEKLVRKTKSILRGLRKSEAGFWVYSPFSLPVHHIAWLRPLNEVILWAQLRLAMRKLRMYDPIVWVACPVGCDMAIKMRKAKLVYQRTDRFEEYPNVDADLINQYDRKLKANADLTIFVNHTLYQEEKTQCKKAMYLDHGVDYEPFAKAEQNPYVPKDIANIPKPIVGFFGGIDGHSSDIPFIEKLIDLLPWMSFVFVGKASFDISTLQSRKNTWLLGQKPYEMIPHYGKYFDVAILPWRQNRWTEAANPIKVKEYLALGKPFVSTPVFTELQQYREVTYIGRTPEEFAARIEQALREDCPERIAERRKKVQTSTWDSKAELVLDELFGKSCE